MQLKGLALKGAPIYADSGIPPTRMPAKDCKETAKIERNVRDNDQKVLDQAFWLRV